MNADDFDRLNELSLKTLNNDATHTELIEFSNLLKMWNVATEFNLFNGKCYLFDEK